MNSMNACQFALWQTVQYIELVSASLKESKSLIQYIYRTLLYSTLHYKISLHFYIIEFYISNGMNIDQLTVVCSTFQIVVKKVFNSDNVEARECRGCIKNSKHLLISNGNAL